MARPLLFASIMEAKRVSFAGLVLGMVGVAAFLAAEGVSSVVRAELEGPTFVPQSIGPPSGDEHPPHTTSADVVLARNPFDAERGPLLPVAAPTPGKTPSIARNNDPYAVPICPDVRLVGSAEARDRGDSRATLTGPTAHLGRSFREGDQIGDLQILLIHWDRVWFRGPTLCQATLMDAPAAPVAIASSAAPAASGVRLRAPGDAVVDRNFLEQIRLDPAAVTKGTKARFEPDGKGLLIADLRPGSPLATLGLVAGDRIEDVNGLPLTSPEQALTAYAKLSVADHASIRVVRNGQPMQIDVAVK